MMLANAFVWIILVFRDARVVRGYNDEIFSTHLAQTPCMTSNCDDRCPDTGTIPPNDYCWFDGGWDKCTITHKKCYCKCWVHEDLSPPIRFVSNLEQCDGTFLLTKDANQDAEVFLREDGKRKMWKSKDGQWNCGPDMSLFTHTCDKEDVVACGWANDEVDKRWRDDGKCGPDHPKDLSDTVPAICNPRSENRCCDYDKGECGSGEGHCRCKNCLNWGLMKGACSLEESSLPVSHCDITPIDQVSLEIGKQMMWNVAGVLSGDIPIVGPVFDFVFAFMDPIGPVSSAFTLTNALIDAANTQIENLQKCMNEQIEDVKVQLIEVDFGQIFDKWGQCKGYSEPEQKDCIQNLYWDFHAALIEFAVEVTSDDAYRVYEELLPVFQSVFPVWIGTVTTRLTYLNDSGNECNFNNDLNSARDGTNTLLTWGKEWALTSISDELRPDTSWMDKEMCMQGSSGDYPIFTDKDWFGASLESTCFDIRGRIDCQTLHVHVGMTRQSKKKCNFLMLNDEFDVAWYPNDMKFDEILKNICEKSVGGARKVADRVVTQLDTEWIPQFKEKFLEQLVKFNESLWDVELKECDSTSAENVHKWVALREQAASSNAENARKKRNRDFVRKGLKSGLTKGELRKRAAACEEKGECSFFTGKVKTEL